jgi:hypothetical protein
MAYKLAGVGEVVEFQLILLTNKAPTTKPESGGTVSSQHQLSGRFMHLTPSYKVQHILVPNKSLSSVQNQRGSVLANFLDDIFQLFL